MTLAAGTRLGPYEILTPLGAGGMGEVYRARDARLGRDVAIKILAETLAASPAAVSRFEQEARAVAALSHPNILAIHDIGQDGPLVFAVTELLEGETLGSLGRLPVRKAVDLALQIAQGLAAAHAKGIAHRDIKPDNLFLTADGHVKILDFGLAKIDAPHPSDQTTVAGPLTAPGTVMGTVGYLSPEQARGEPGDTRSDIFAFGAVLYELLAGTRAFSGPSSVDTLHRILHDEPAALDVLAPPPPVELRRIVAKCLAKDPDERYQSTRDLVVDLRAVARDLESSPNLAVPLSSDRAGVRRPGPLTWAVVAAAAAALVLSGMWWRSRASSDRSSTAAGVNLSIEGVTALGTVIDAAVSPDGKYVAYVVSANARQSLWLRQLASASTLELTPAAPIGFWGITFSPDGSAIYYAAFTNEHPDHVLLRIPTIGGTPRPILTGIDSRPSFSPDGASMTYVRGDYPEPGSSSLMVADRDGGHIRPLLTRRPPEFFVPVFFTGPAWSPDGSVIVVPLVRRTRPTVGTFLAVHARDGSEAPFPHFEWSAVGQANWAPDGAGLVAVAASAQSGRMQVWWLDPTHGTRRQVTRDLLDYRAVSLTSDGTTLVAVGSDTTSSIWTVPSDGSGPARKVSVGRYDGLDGLAAILGGRMLYRSVEGGGESIWIADEDGGHSVQVTATGSPSNPVPMPEGGSGSVPIGPSETWHQNTPEGQ